MSISTSSKCLLNTSRDGNPQAGTLARPGPLAPCAFSYDSPLPWGCDMFTRTGDTALQDARMASVMAGQSPRLPAAQGRMLLQCPRADPGRPRAGRKLRGGGGRGKAGQMHSPLQYAQAPSAHHDGTGPGPTEHHFCFRRLDLAPPLAPPLERRPRPLPGRGCSCGATSQLLNGTTAWNRHPHPSLVPTPGTAISTPSCC